MEKKTLAKQKKQGRVFDRHIFSLVKTIYFTFVLQGIMESDDVLSYTLPICFLETSGDETAPFVVLKTQATHW